MKLREFVCDDDAVSPVIGVVLMVAVTVILAAATAAYVFGVGGQVSDTEPQASFNFDFDYSGGSTGTDLAGTSESNNGNLTITHTGGASIEGQLLTVTDDDGDGPISLFNTGSTDVTPGTSDTVSVGQDDRVNIVWENAEGTSSATLETWEGPQY